MENEKPTFIKDIEDQFRGVRGRGKRNNRHPFAVSHEQADMTDLATSASHWKTQMLQANGLQSEAELEAKNRSTPIFLSAYATALEAPPVPRIRARS